MGIQGKVKIPPEAYKEYNLKLDTNAVLFSGSKTSGGFGLSSVRILKESIMKELLDENSSLANYTIPEGEIISFKNKKCCWLKIHEDKSVILPEKTLKAFRINRNDILLSGRGSHLAIAFIAKGPIFFEAKNHPEIEIF